VRVLERCTNGDGRNEAIESLKSGIDRATRLVGQLLTLARVEPEVPLMPFAQVSLNGLTKEIIAEQACVAADKDVNLGLNFDGQVLVYGEPNALRAMISNLIDNAIQHTLPGGTIDVNVHKNELAAIIEIADTGPGISPEDRERVFDRFYRSKGVSSNGCGLGLAIVKSAVNRHGGTITLGETIEGKGLRVVIELPLHI
jgi:two-component system OmpR family sensor kinase